VAEEAMKETPNAQPRKKGNGSGCSTLNVEILAEGNTSNIKLRTSNILWRILDFVLAAIFIYAGALKAFDPVQFASDIDNYKLLPWPVSVALAFYLPWLEIFCALGLVFRFLYRGALSILSVSIVVFTLATIAAKVRGLDITCGCFGHASQHWSFSSHLATNLAILAALLALGFSSRLRKPL
jgi:putative oxidoreductase